MPDKYSLAKCEQYGRRLAARLCQQHFGTQPAATLDGPALLKFTSLRQVNLLVLQQLLGRWQHEATQLRSPYFDFEAAPVQAALAQFMNVLSRHISVGRAALEPLLAQAVAYTLLLATDPAAAFARLLLPPAEAGPEATVPLPYLRERLRYFDQSKALLEGFLDGLPAGNAPLSRDFLLQRFELHRASHYQQVPALAPLVAELSALLPLTEADLWDDGPSKAAPTKAVAASPAATSPAAPPAPAAAPIATPAPAAELPPATPAEMPAAPAPVAATAPAELPAAPTAEPAATSPSPVPKPETAVSPGVTGASPPAAAPLAPALPTPPVPTSRPAAPPVVPSFVPAGAEAPAAVPLYEKLKATQATGPHLADTLRGTVPEAAPRLAERGAPRVGSLREGISINQRYSFIYELFNGETTDYNDAIEHLDQLPTAAAAQAYVLQELAARYDWARKEEHIGKLLKLVERRFTGA